MAALNFKVIAAKLDKVKKGPNKGEPIVKLTLFEDDPFAEKNSKQTVTLFIDESQVAGWEDRIAKNDIPNVKGVYTWVDTKAYRTKDENGDTRDRVLHKMRVWTRCDASGTPLEDAATKANRIIEQLCEWAPEEDVQE